MAFEFDGVFVGATWTRDMRNLMLAALAVYLALFLALRPFGNAGLWAALLGFLVARGALQGWRYTALEGATFPRTAPSSTARGARAPSPRTLWTRIEAPPPLPHSPPPPPPATPPRREGVRSRRRPARAAPSQELRRQGGRPTAPAGLSPRRAPGGARTRRARASRPEAAGTVRAASEGHPGFRAGAGWRQAVMGAGAERQVPALAACQVEPVGLREGVGVAVRGRDQRHDGGAGRQLDPREPHRLGRVVASPPPRPGW